MGDSSAAGVGASHQENALSGQIAQRLSKTNHLSWRLEAKTSATSQSTLNHLKILPEQHFDTAILIVGVNDVTGNVTLASWLRTQHALHAVLNQRFGVTSILRTAVPPMEHFPLLPQPLRWTLGQTARRFDRALSRLCCETPGAVHIPFDLPHRPEYAAQDGFHPSEKAYAAWSDLIVKNI
ncbi:SGNH/GDSL hydrolase family protein [Rhodalgimonas zhirmunskyi]|uniref:SGNH/GDSL hydrolase family protein n=1 Tax=Rhodalgimonas zhirmunskyi TaxID=2964767 RepID=A0AAJ1X616_9RHOB|nr:SGNH/GDSL hydrolase family protein [Rhodoalgimonas zhirmunskyi]MDQ2095061.1 SGNH/GDSL hydrolase family protein [Rhodoalgimonas zhirmunskyi]